MAAKKREDPEMEAIKSELKGLMMKKGQLLKDFMEKMRVDQLNHLDKRLEELLEKIPDKYLDNKATGFVKKFGTIPTPENVDALLAKKEVTKKDQVRDSVVMPPPPSSSKGRRGPGRARRNATAEKTVVVTPVVGKRTTPRKVLPLPGKRPIKTGETIWSSRGSMLGTFEEDPEDSTPAAESTPTRK
jgi:hypothetical protein